MSTFPALPAELTIYAVTELRAQWLAALDPSSQDAEIAVDASAVAEVDAAGVQLLRALSAQLARHDRVLRLERPSARLAEACAALGLASLLGADEPAASEAA